MIKPHQISSFRPDTGFNSSSGQVMVSNGSGGVTFTGLNRMAVGRLVTSAANMTGTQTFSFSHTFNSNVPELNTLLSNFRLVNNSGSVQTYYMEVWPQFSAMGSNAWGKIDYGLINSVGTFLNWNAGNSTVLPSNSSYATFYAPFAWAHFGVATGETVEVRVQFSTTTGATTTLSPNSLWKLFRA